MSSSQDFVNGEGHSLCSSGSVQFPFHVFFRDEFRFRCGTFGLLISNRNAVFLLTLHSLFRHSAFAIFAAVAQANVTSKSLGKMLSKLQWVQFDVAGAIAEMKELKSRLD